MVEQLPGYGPAAPVPIFQWQAEFERLLRLYVKRKPKRVLEIGTYHGGTLYHWLQNARPGTTVVSVDSYVAGVDNRALYQEWCPPRVKVVTIEGDSNSAETAAKVKKHGPFDWVWIDADHRLRPGHARLGALQRDVRSEGCRLLPRHSAAERRLPRLRRQPALGRSEEALPL